MNDIKISHVIPKVADGVLSQLTINYGKVSPISVRRSNMHDYLGMRLDYSTKGKVWITMPKQIRGILESATEDMKGISENPSANHLFTVKEDCGMLTCV